MITIIIVTEAKTIILPQSKGKKKHLFFAKLYKSVKIKIVAVRLPIIAPQTPISLTSI